MASKCALTPLFTTIIQEEPIMKIAVASQNRHQITEHAGRCRKFWIYETSQDSVTRKELLELPKEQSFHESSPHEPHPLDGVQVLIAGNMGTGLVRRLEAKGINAVITPETDPDKAVAGYLDGSLVVGVPCAHEHAHDEESEHEHACHCGE
jgi:predicted Fe-Mo cluster-binding NifX family protein